MRHRLLLASLPVVLALVIGCASDDDAPLVTGAGPSPGGGETVIEGSTGNGGKGATPTPAPTPTPSESPTASPSATPTTSVPVGTDPGMPTPSVETLPTPYAPPSPTPTPLGQVGTGVSAIAARDLAVGPRDTVPWILSGTALMRAGTQGAEQPLPVTLPANPLFVREDDAGAVWVAGESELVRYTAGMFDDWARQSVPLSAAPSDMAVAGDAVWLCSQAGGTVTRVNLTSLAATSFAVPGAVAIALDSQAVWVATAGASLLRLDRTSGAELRSPVAVGAGVRSVAVSDDGAVWTANRTARTLTRLANAVAAPVTLPLAATPLSLRPAGSYLWVGGDDGRAYVFAGETLYRTITLPLVPRVAAKDGLGRLWFLDTALGQAVPVWGN